MSFPHLPEISYFYLHKFWIQAVNQPPTLFCQSSYMHMYDRKQFFQALTHLIGARYANVLWRREH